MPSVVIIFSDIKKLWIKTQLGIGWPWSLARFVLGILKFKFYARPVKRPTKGGGGVCMSLVWISKPVISYIEEEAMLLCGISLLYSRFSMSLSQFQPILVSLVTISAVLCHCFKATSLVGILPPLPSPGTRPL